MSLYAIYDAASGRILHMVRGSAALVAANTPAGAAVLESPVGDLIDPMRDRIDVSGAPFKTPRAPLPLATSCTLAQLAALDLPSDAVVKIGVGGVLAPGDLAAFAALRAELEPVTTRLEIDPFPFAPHAGVIIV